MSGSSAGRKRAAQRARTDLGPFVSVEVEGTKYLLTARDMSALDVRAMRDQLGFSYNGLVDRLRLDMDVDLLAAVVWMTRRIHGERDLTYAEVAEELHYGVEYQFVAPEVEGDGDELAVGDHAPEG